MKKSIFKVLCAFTLCLGLVSIGSTTAKANTVTSSENYGSYGTLKGINSFFKEAGSPLAKRVDLTAQIGKKVNYVGVKLSVKNYSTGSNYYTSGGYGAAGTSYHSDWDFLKQEYANVYNNKCSAFGTHEFRHTTSGVVYTSTYC